MMSIKNKIVQTIYDGVRSVITLVSPTLTSKITYRVSWGKRLNLKNPEDFNQKLMWLKLNIYGNDPVVAQCVDKYGVRQYVIDHNCSEILNDLIGVCDHVEANPWEDLPEKFVLKMTNSSGANIICRDKNRLDISKAKNQLDRWYKRNYYLTNAEIQYRTVPKRIICEKYIDSGTNVPTDYKFYCFYGKPELVMAIADRGPHTRKHFYDMNWDYLDCKGERGALIDRPQSLEEMIVCCHKLASQFPFVRMDFYEHNGKPIFGEMTFTPAGCIGKSYSPEIYKRLGEKTKLPVPNSPYGGMSTE